MYKTKGPSDIEHKLDGLECMYVLTFVELDFASILLLAFLSAEDSSPCVGAIRAIYQARIYIGGDPQAANVTRISMQVVLFCR